MQQHINRYKYTVVKVFRSHQTFVVLVGALLVLMVVLLRINTLGNIPSDEQYLNQKLSEIQLVKFNAEAIEQIKALNDSNVGTPGTQLPSNRSNPFNE